MQINLTLLWLIPLCIEQQIAGVAEFLDALGVECFSIRHSKGMIIAHVLLGQPIGHLILVCVFDITTKLMKAAVYRRSAPLSASLIEIGLASRSGRQAFQNKQTRKTQSTLKAALEDGRVDTRSVQVWPVHFKVAMRVFGQPILVRGAASAEVDMIDLGDKTTKGAWGHVDLLSIVSTASGVDVKASQDLADRFVNTENNLRLSENTNFKSSGHDVGPT